MSFIWNDYRLCESSFNLVTFNRLRFMEELNKIIQFIVDVTIINAMSDICFETFVGLVFTEGIF